MAAADPTPTTATPPAAARRRRGAVVPSLKPDAEADPKRRRLIEEAQLALDALRQFDAQRQVEERKKRTRMAMLLGTFMLDNFDRDKSGKLRDATIAQLDRALANKTDRELFGLAPRA
jgi:hypothetical protein